MSVLDDKQPAEDGRARQKDPAEDHVEEDLHGQWQRHQKRTEDDTEGYDADARTGQHDSRDHLATSGRAGTMNLYDWSGIAPTDGRVNRRLLRRIRATRRWVRPMELRRGLCGRRLPGCRRRISSSGRLEASSTHSSEILRAVKSSSHSARVSASASQRSPHRLRNDPTDEIRAADNQRSGNGNASTVVIPKRYPNTEDS